MLQWKSQSNELVKIRHNAMKDLERANKNVKTNSNDLSSLLDQSDSKSKRNQKLSLPRFFSKPILDIAEKMNRMQIESSKVLKTERSSDSFLPSFRTHNSRNAQSIGSFQKSPLQRDFENKYNKTPKEKAAEELVSKKLNILRENETTEMKEYK